jgi:tRNA A37 threonylcarbamoyladenosine dehydratase
MLDSFSRTRLLIGPEALAKLQASTVAVFGIGGVGSWAAEALARAGVGGFVLVDDDSVCVTNINRQIIALRSTVGRPKVEVMKERILAINPDAHVAAFQERYEAETAEHFFAVSAGSPGADNISYVVDAIDTVSSKIDLVMRAQAALIPIMSAMGAGNKLDPTRFEVADIYETSVCPLARVMRYELRRRGVRHLKVVYSREPPRKIDAAAAPGGQEGSCPGEEGAGAGRRCVPASISFVPPVAGFIIASEVVKDLIGG